MAREPRAALPRRPIKAGHTRSPVISQAQPRSGRIRALKPDDGEALPASLAPFALDYAHHIHGRSLAIHADGFEWLGRIPTNSLHAVITDPPYGVKEYDFEQIEKRANGNGGIWRIPPSFDGHTRAPLPRFTALNDKERAQLRRFFVE